MAFAGNNHLKILEIEIMRNSMNACTLSFNQDFCKLSYAIISLPGNLE